MVLIAMRSVIIGHPTFVVTESDEAIFDASSPSSSTELRLADSSTVPGLECRADVDGYDDGIQKRSEACSITDGTSSSIAPSSRWKLKLLSDTPCTASPLPRYLSCGGGKEVRSEYYGGAISYVSNCVRGKFCLGPELRILWWGEEIDVSLSAKAIFIAKRGKYPKVYELEEYCCENFEDEASLSTFSAKSTM